MQHMQPSSSGAFQVLLCVSCELLGGSWPAPFSSSAEKQPRSCVVPHAQKKGQLWSGGVAGSLCDCSPQHTGCCIAHRAGCVRVRPPGSASLRLLSAAEQVTAMHRGFTQAVLQG